MRKHLKYLSYIIRHKWFVYLAGRKTGAPLWRLIIHDWSKLLPCEWFPYTERYYGRQHVISDPDCRKHGPFSYCFKCGASWQRKENYARAWLHHLHLNPHHWQHWILREDNGNVRALPMPEPLVREMVADWLGAGRAITGKWEAREWYIKNRNLMTLHDKTAFLVAELLGV